MVTQALQTALMVYFESKQLMYRRIPEFVFRETGPLKCFHKHPGWPEVDAFYAVDVEPGEAITAIAKYAPHPQHMLTVFQHSPQEPDTAYEALGYRSLSGSQPLMSLELSLLTVRPESSVVLVETREQMDFINQPGTYMDASHLNDDAFRYYYLEQDGLAVCRGRTVLTTQSALYVAGIDTVPAYRRRGFAGTLMGQMHADALAKGARRSVLCSSPLGLGLYQALGYTTLATMQAFVPISPLTIL